MRYTKKDDEIIIKHVRNNMDNLSVAFEQAAKVLNKTKGAVSQRYYAAIKTNTTHPVYAIGNGESFQINSKVNKRKNDPLYVQVIDNLSEKDKVEIALHIFTTLNRNQIAKMISSLITKTNP
jgi:hypothetical protein